MASVTFVLQDGTERAVEAEVGWKLMEVAVNESIPGIYGDCGGEAQCATCHVHVEPQWREVTGQRNPTEEAMLNNAFDVTDASRLSCQIIVDDAMDGLIVEVVDS
ncbi:2Fe-2S iron-sulfur cluster-binding protein [Rathayibacter sp. CAU 1779]